MKQVGAEFKRGDVLRSRGSGIVFIFLSHDPVSGLSKTIPYLPGWGSYGIIWETSMARYFQMAAMECQLWNIFRSWQTFDCKRYVDMLERRALDSIH